MNSCRSCDFNKERLNKLIQEDLSQSNEIGARNGLRPLNGCSYYFKLFLFSAAIALPR